MNTYAAHVIDTNKVCHKLYIQSETFRGVKAQARKAATAQGITVLYVESVFGA